MNYFHGCERSLNLIWLLNYIKLKHLEGKRKLPSAISVIKSNYCHHLAANCCYCHLR